MWLLQFFPEMFSAIYMKLGCSPQNPKVLCRFFLAELSSKPFLAASANCCVFILVPLVIILTSSVILMVLIQRLWAICYAVHSFWIGFTTMGLVWLLLQATCCSVISSFYCRKKIWFILNFSIKYQILVWSIPSFCNKILIMRQICFWLTKIRIAVYQVRYLYMFAGVS